MSSPLPALLLFDKLQSSQGDTFIIVEFKYFIESCEYKYTFGCRCNRAKYQAMPAIFKRLVEMGYAGYVNLEYEIDARDPLPGMLRSFAYMRGVIHGLGMVEG